MTKLLTPIDRRRFLQTTAAAGLGAALAASPWQRALAAGTVNFADIADMISAFQGYPYKYSDPGDCPADVGAWS